MQYLLVLHYVWKRRTLLNLLEMNLLVCDLSNGCCMETTQALKNYGRIGGAKFQLYLFTELAVSYSFVGKEESVH